MSGLFEAQKFKIDKPIRLIELFGGIGSQAMALRNIGADFEHYRLVEFDKYAVQSYNTIHGTNFRTQDIKEIHAEDLSITKTNRYCYIMCYSFPCQDLSIAGRGRGMKKEMGTRSGLLWEVERILEECEELPQVLLMENVSQVHGKKNLDDFHAWIDFLKSKGYWNFWSDLNAKDYGIPQNRVRCFMVSILSDGYVEYEFPEKKELKLVMKDLLEDSVDEKYYINNEKAQKLIEQIIMNDKKETIDLTINKPEKNTVANCICAKDRGIADRRKKSNGVIEKMKVKVIAKMDNTYDNTYESTNRIYSQYGLCSTISTCMGGLLQPKILENEENMIDTQICAMRGRGENNEQRLDHGAKDNLVMETPRYRIRKLTPRECWRLMGFSDADYNKASAVNSNTQLYKQAGNSIVVNVLMSIFSQML